MRTAGLKGARCVGQTNLFYSPLAAHIAKAKAICAWCPAFQECKVLGRNEKEGVWAAQLAPGRRKP